MLWVACSGFNTLPPSCVCHVAALASDHMAVHAVCKWFAVASVGTRDILVSRSSKNSPACQIPHHRRCFNRFVDYL